MSSRLSTKTGLVTIAVIVAAALMFAQGNHAPHSGSCCPSIISLNSFAAEAAEAMGTNASARAALPRLLELGADKCIPCKLMARVLDELKQKYEGQMAVDFIDVWKNPDVGKAYKIHLIPTQIFFDATGKELFRHEGFFSKDDILAKWKELGVEFKGKAVSDAKK